MAGAWRALVVVGLAVTARAAHCQVSYETIAALAEQYFNQERRGQTLFRLLEAIPPPHWNSNSTIPLKFRIKATMCLWTQLNQLQECAFRQGGKKNCTGSFSRLPHFRLERFRCVIDPPLQQKAPDIQHSAESSEVLPTEIDSSKLPPSVRDLYLKAKFDLISNILRNF